ncbi:MAG: hypothetical protein IID14_07775 [Candidatus Marinimicrobia bacterium]|nr:hypothetical protein [Candidatus Neomarinimicrobiota bacterium]
MGRRRVIRPALGFLLLSALLNGQVLPADSLLGQGHLPLISRLDITPKQQEFDPVTGDPLGQKPKPKIDPNTGLPLEPDSADPKPVQIDPDTGLPMAPVGEEPPQLPFDPVTGEPVPAELAEPGVATAEVGFEPTLESVITTAEAEALRDHHQEAHVLLGGAGCLFSWIGVPLTALYVESGISRFDENSASLSATYYRSLPVDLQSAYKKAYRNKEKSLRRKSVYGTQGICLLAFIGLIFIGGGI